MRMTTLPKHWPDLAGKMQGAAHILPVRVYYEDTDFSGAVYHANYLKFCERARSDALRLLGVHHGELLSEFSFVVRRLACDFLKPAQINDLLEVETRFIEIAGARLELDQRIRRGQAAIFEAKVTVAIVDRKGRPRRLPEAMLTAMAGMCGRQS